MRLCESATELRELAFAPGASIVVAEPTDRSGHATWPVLADIRRGFSSLPVMGYCTLRASLSTDVADFARAGVHDIIMLDIDDTVVCLRAKASKARCVGTAEWALNELAPVLRGAIEPLVHYCLLNASRAMTVEELATVLGAHRKTLVNRCRDAGAPPPGNIVSWCRLVMAGRLLEDLGRPIEHIAFELGFPSAGALRAMMKRYVQLNPHELRAQGGAAYVLAAMTRTLSSRATPSAGVKTNGARSLVRERNERAPQLAS